MRVYGIDFTSTPSARKPLSCAVCVRRGGELAVEKIELWRGFAPLQGLLRKPGPWAAGFDFPFGFPRAFVEHSNLPTDWTACMAAIGQLSRPAYRRLVREFCARQPEGKKYLKRACDVTARSQSPLNVVNPPVGLMLHEGGPRLAASDCSLPAHARANDSRKLVIETYPALLAEKIIAKRPYKNDNPKKGGALAPARRDIVAALQSGRLGLPVRLAPALAQQMIAEPGADQLDALLCAVAAAMTKDRPNFGLPDSIDPLEGWIALTPHHVNPDISP